MAKGALDKHNIIPQLFPKKVGIIITLEELPWIISLMQWYCAKHMKG